jgi:hypothetical protein
MVKSHPAGAVFALTRGSGFHANHHYQKRFDRLARFANAIPDVVDTQEA